MQPDHHYEMARRRVEKKRKFHRHLRVYLVMSVFFIVINIIGGSHIWWAQWPILGWGLGIFFQGMAAYGGPGDTSEWEEKEIEKELRRLNRGKESDSDWINRHPERSAPPRDVNRPYRDEDLV